MKNIRLLEVSKSYFPVIGGLELSVRNRVRIYEELGIDCDILTTQSGMPDGGAAGLSDPVKITRLKSRTSYHFTPAVKNYDFSNYDIISVNQLGKFISDYTIVKNSGKRRIILTPHFYFHTGRHESIKKLYDQFLTRYLIERVDIMICFTEVEKNFWTGKFGVDPEKIDVIPHYIETGSLSEEEPGIGDSDFLLYLGRIDTNKRVDLLIDAYARSERENTLLMTLNQSDFARYFGTKEFKKTRFCGKVSDSRRNSLLRNCRGVIFPSDYEAFGLVLLEASYFKKPIICSDIPVFREILDERGVIFFKNDRESIMAALEEFDSADQKKLDLMGETNFRNLSRFEFSRVRDLYGKLIGRLMS